MQGPVQKKKKKDPPIAFFFFFFYRHGMIAKPEVFFLCSYIVRSYIQAFYNRRSFQIPFFFFLFYFFRTRQDSWVITH